MSVGAPADPATDSPELRARAVLAQRARVLARPTRHDTSGQLLPLVLFGIGGVAHAVEARFVREVLRRPALSMVPSAPAALVGVASVRGEILVVADISALLGLRAPSMPGPVIVLDGPGPSLGLLVEAVHDFTEVPVDSIVPLPHGGTPTGPAPESLLLGATDEATVLSGTAMLTDPRFSTTTEPRSGR
ncbi:MAG TPA: chemotaxis protein CheW [Acidimicrobiales bacterium]|nr:chemotaxis protein CheW [Acidimicrobiales bacterium]